MFIVACIPLVFPGDAPFVNDEPQLFIGAFQANMTHRLAIHGLTGSIGLLYGPLPTWFYQLVISITTVPENWVLLRAGFMTVMIISGLVFLQRGTGLWKWFLPIVMVSPYLWYYSRHLWDNSFLLPFSSLALGFYVFSLKLQKEGKNTTAFYLILLLAIATTLILPFIHFMAIPLTLALLLHMTLYLRKVLYKLLIPTIALLLIVFYLHASYLEILIVSLKNLHPNVSVSPSGWWQGWIFPFLGGRMLSGAQLSYFFGRDWLPDNFVFIILTYISYIAYIMVFGGIYRAGYFVWKQIIFPDKSRNKAIDVQTHLALIALISFVLQIIVGGVSHAFFHPHYYNGMWIIYVYFAWLAVDRIIFMKWGKLTVFVYGISLATILCVVIILAHQRHGGRRWATIENQLEIARKLGNQPRTDVNCKVGYLSKYPSLNALQIICVKDNRERINGPVVIEYATKDRRSGLVRIKSDVKR